MSSAACELSPKEASEYVRNVMRNSLHSRKVGSPGGYDQNRIPLTFIFGNRSLVPWMYSQCSCTVVLWIFVQVDSSASKRSMNTVVGAFAPRQKRGLVACTTFVSAISSVSRTSENCISASLKDAGCSQSTACSSASPPDIIRRAAVGVPSLMSVAE